MLYLSGDPTIHTLVKHTILHVGGAAHCPTLIMCSYLRNTCLKLWTKLRYIYVQYYEKALF